MNRFEEILQDVHYKDWFFYLGHDEGRSWLQVKFLAPDAATGAGVVQAGRKWFLSEHMTRSEVVQTALKAVLTAEEHEARERFAYRGKRIFGPHINVDALHEVCSELDVREEPDEYGAAPEGDGLASRRTV